MVTAVVLLGGAIAGVALKVRHDRDQERQAAAAELQLAAEQEQEEVETKEAARRARQEAQAAAEKADRDERTELIRQMQKSITKDAKKRVTDGELEGPIYYTSCDPLGGGSVDDLTALTTTFECLAVNEKLGGGRVSGWAFSATATGTRAVGAGGSVAERRR